MSTNQPTNPHRGSDFTEFMSQEGLMPTPRTDAIAHSGHNESVYIARMTYLARELERELAAERALADRLANALDDIAFGTIIRRESGGCGQSLICTPEQLQNYAHRALAAWKEARRGTD